MDVVGRVIRVVVLQIKGQQFEPPQTQCGNNSFINYNI